MRDHKDCQPQRFLQRLDQIVELARRNGIEAGRRLVEKHDFGIEPRRCAAQKLSKGAVLGMMIKPSSLGRGFGIVLASEPGRTAPHCRFPSAPSRDHAADDAADNSGGWTLEGHEANSTWLRPLSLARYSASSAREISDSAVSPHMY